MNNDQKFMYIFNDIFRPLGEKIYDLQEDIPEQEKTTRKIQENIYKINELCDKLNP